MIVHYEDSSVYHPEGLDECYCDDGHKSVNTVCMWCWNRGSRHWNDKDWS
jgi:hypothetical protein